MQEYEDPADRWAFLAPWTAQLRDHDVRVKVQYANEHTYRSTFDAVELTLEDGVADGERASELAEAVELVATALARCPDAWPTVLVGQCECVDFFNPQNEPLTMRLQFDCTMLGAADLTSTTGLQFFDKLMGGECAPRSRAFEEAQQQVDLLAGVPEGAISPVGITVRLTMGDGGVDHQDSVTVIKALERYSLTRTRRSWCVLEAIDFDWTETAIDSAIVDRAHWLVTKKPLVRVSRVVIYPLEARCFEADLRAFIVTLVRAYPDLELELGDIRRSHVQALVLELCVTSTTLVMQVIANAGVSIKCLHVGQIALQQSHPSRRRMWDYLFGTLLHHDARSRVEHLVLDSHRLLEIDADADLINEVSARYIGYRTPSTLTLALTNARPSSVHAIIDVFAAELRSLCIVDSEQPIPPETVAFIVRSCPRLTVLDLNNVALDSLNVFCAQPSRLSTLALTNVTLRDRTSVSTFLAQLGDARSALGRHLVEFRLARAGDPAAMWDKLVLNSSADIAQLRRVLQANDRLQTLYVEVEDETPQWVMTDLVHAHRKSVAVRKAPLALACKVAYLSATMNRPSPSPSSPYHLLSHDVIGHVFEFAAECMLRWVYVGKSFV